MVDRPSLIQQVSSITGCNDYQAETVLERSNWDVERAMNAFFDDPPPERPPFNSNTNSQGSSTAVVPFQASSDPTSGWDVPNNPAFAPPPGQPPASNSGWSTDNKDVIDFTNDADTDEDLRRAMAASLQDQQSQQTYRPPAPSSTVGDIGMSEDEQLRQALEASVQSHHDLLQSAGSGARTPTLPQHLDTDLQSRRAHGAPVAMAAPFTSLEVVAALLQALFAAPPVRIAYLASRPVDTRGSDFSNYWRGVPPTDPGADSAAEPTLDTHTELVRRVQTLFAFATLSQRPLCVVKDVTSLSPSEVIARGADRSPADKVAALFYEFVVDSFAKHVAAVSETILKTAGAEPAETDALWMNDALFLSSGAAALTNAASPRINGTQDDPQVHATAPPKVEQQRSFIQLRHDSINSDTYSCLRAALASDGEGALLTRTASVISMGVDHAFPTAEGGPPPFTINDRIYLDSLMWDRRQGVRLDAELRDEEMRRLDTMRQDLEARKRKLAGDGGRPMREVLLGATRYFEQVATPADSTDAIRAASLAEAGPQISKISQAVQADLTATDQLIAKIRVQIDAKRALVAERAKREASNPEWRQLAYDLCAVLYTEGGSCVSLVKQQPSGTWWKISAGRAVQVQREDVVMGRAQDPSLGVFWLVYARAEQEGTDAQEKQDVAEGLISETIKAAVADDNLTYESELLSLIRSDAATPSSIATDANDGEEDGRCLVQAPDGEADMVTASGRVSPHAVST
ncbi:hypothetical protein EX895_002561 [Sporisorium graminicola]|uniref:TAP-C domain-containing protein n=1 Tax=Sporisorium graminicola TaxID=280036 RepID=A0A4U7L079_9BASI|nr:hypothetical protein EX895_002561 [Sporisorium graminicola]TKY88572.1 hypothetical protein EX895_002561 [Sporisorium graminicola]